MRRWTLGRPSRRRATAHRCHPSCTASRPQAATSLPEGAAQPRADALPLLLLPTACMLLRRPRPGSPAPLSPSMPPAFYFSRRLLGRMWGRTNVGNTNFREIQRYTSFCGEEAAYVERRGEGHKRQSESASRAEREARLRLKPGRSGGAARWARVGDVRGEQLFLVQSKYIFHVRRPHTSAQSRPYRGAVPRAVFLKAAVYNAVPIPRAHRCAGCVCPSVPRGRSRGPSRLLNPELGRVCSR